MELHSLADLHIHTTYSDGTATVPDVLAHVAASNLHVIAITDHDAIAGALEARQLARDFGVEVIVGEEVSTAEGHVLALFIEDVLPPGRPAAETIAAIHAQGGLCVAPHPYDWAVVSLGRWGLRERCFADWRFDAIEGFNASLTWPRSGANKQAQHVALELGIPAVGGSDAHSVATIGTGVTRFAGTSADDLYRAIQGGLVAWDGHTWTAAQYFDIGWRTVRQRNGWGAIKLVCTDLPFVQPRPVRPPRAASLARQHAKRSMLPTDRTIDV
jgi:hypothetical protein